MKEKILQSVEDSVRATGQLLEEKAVIFIENAVKIIVEAFKSGNLR